MSSGAATASSLQSFDCEIKFNLLNFTKIASSLALIVQSWSPYSLCYVQYPALVSELYTFPFPTGVYPSCSLLPHPRVLESSCLRQKSLHWCLALWPYKVGKTVPGNCALFAWSKSHAVHIAPQNSRLYSTIASPRLTIAHPGAGWTYTQLLSCTRSQKLKTTSNIKRYSECFNICISKEACLLIIVWLWWIVQHTEVGPRWVIHWLQRDQCVRSETELIVKVRAYDRSDGVGLLYVGPDVGRVWQWLWDARHTILKAVRPTLDLKTADIFVSRLASSWRWDYAESKYSVLTAIR